MRKFFWKDFPAVHQSKSHLHRTTQSKDTAYSKMNILLTCYVTVQFGF
jgi:hypothetical protein